MMETAKKTKGRQKVEMRPISDESKRHVAFSKRKAGLFNKAAELNVLTGAEVAAIVLSRQGKAYSFATPASDSAFAAWIGLRDGAGIPHPPSNHISPAADGAGRSAWREVQGLEDANRRLAERRRGAEKAAEKMRGSLGLGFFWWELPESSMETADELESFEEALVEMRKKVAERAAAIRPTMPFTAMQAGGSGGGEMVEGSNFLTDFADVEGGRGAGNREDINGLILNSPSSDVYS